MSISNLFDELVASQPVANANGTVTVPSTAKVGPDDPASLGRIIAIAKFFRRKNLLAETDPTWLAIFAKLAVFDSDTGYWIPPVGFTQGEAKDLQDRLYALPYKGKATPATVVTTGQAAPLPKATVVTDSAIANRVAEAEASATVQVASGPEDRIGRLERAVLRLAEAFHRGSAPSEPEANDQRIPEGFEVRFGKKGPYLAKAK